MKETIKKPQFVEKFSDKPNELESIIFEDENSWRVMLFDTGAQKYVPYAKIFPKEKFEINAARKFAKNCVA